MVGTGGAPIPGIKTFHYLGFIMRLENGCQDKSDDQVPVVAGSWGGTDTSQRRPRLGRSVGLLKNVAGYDNIPVTVALQGSVNSAGVLQVDFALSA